MRSTMAGLGAALMLAASALVNGLTVEGKSTVVRRNVTTDGFTPQDMLGAPRRSTAVPNPSGNLAVFQWSQYVFDNHSSTSGWTLIDLASGGGDMLELSWASAVSEIVWIDDNTVLSIQSSTDIPSGIELWVGDVHDDVPNRSLAATIPAPLSGLKAVVASGGDIKFLLNGLADQNNGTAYNEDLVETPLSSARIYDTPFVRHWGTYITPQRYNVFAGTLATSNSTNSTYSLVGSVKNLMWGLNLESPVQPFGDSGDYDLSPDGTTVAFLSKDPQLPVQNNTASYIYLVPHDGSAKPVALNGPESPGTPPLARGASGGPAFSPDGAFIAYHQQDQNAYESDKSKQYIGEAAINGSIRGVATEWDRSINAATWSPDGQTLFLNVEEYTREKIFTVPSSAGVDDTPAELIGEGSVSSVFPMQNGTTLLVSASSMMSSLAFSVFSLTDNSSRTLLQPTQADDELAGLDANSQLDEFWIDGAAAGTQVHSWIVKPIDFDESQSYPLAFLIHGGPQGAWTNSWSTRWNPAVFANQGYVVILPDPTGSTGYGKAFEDAIQNNWGGTPYEDLVAVFDYVAANISYIDTSRAVAAGASYGGYMTNYIQGQPLGRKFRALVTHDGIFSTLDNYASEELWFVQHDFNGTLWDDRSNYERWDPAKFILNWSTPHLIVHSDMDYRLPISEGLSMFNALTERGVPTRFLNFPDETHWVTKPENSLVWHKEVLGWLNKYSGANGGKVKL